MAVPTRYFTDKGIVITGIIPSLGYTGGTLHPGLPDQLVAMLGTFYLLEHRFRAAARGV